MSSFNLPDAGVHVNDTDITTGVLQTAFTQAATGALDQAQQGGAQLSNALADGYAQAQAALQEAAAAAHQQALPTLTQIDGLLQSQAPTADSLLASVVEIVEPLHGGAHLTLVGSTVGAPADSLLAAIGQAANDAFGGQAAAGFDALRGAVHTATDGQATLAVNGSGSDFTGPITSLLDGLKASGANAANGNLELNTASLGQAVSALPLDAVAGGITAGGQEHTLADGAAPLVAVLQAVSGDSSPLSSNAYVHAGPAAAPVNMLIDSLSALHAPALPSIASLTDPANLPTLPPLPGH